MTDKTCGSCINLMRDYIEEQNGYVGGACRVSLFGGKYRYVYSADACTEPLDLYEERTDSLEQWARDMLIFLDNDEGAFCEHCVGNGEGCYGEYLCATMAEARNNFLVRLKALGVKP